MRGVLGTRREEGAVVKGGKVVGVAGGKVVVKEVGL